MPETREIEPELLQRLGLLIVRFSLIENWVSDLFVKMVEGERGSMYVVTENVSQSTITGWIRTLLYSSNTHPDEVKEICDVLNDIDELRAERNALVHGMWITSGPNHSAIVQTVRLERKAPVQETVVTAADLDDLICRCVEVATELKKILCGLDAYP